MPPHERERPLAEDGSRGPADVLVVRDEASTGDTGDVKAVSIALGAVAPR